MRDIFVSKPNTLTEGQQELWQQLEGRLKERSLRPRTLGTTDYSNAAPIGAVKNVTDRCHGVLILGLRQIRVTEGIAKEDTNEKQVLRNHLLPTPWNHIEAGMGFAWGLPPLIIKEQGVSGGVFDLGISGSFVHEVMLPSEEWLRSEAFLQPLNEWVEEVTRHDLGSR